MNFELDDDFWEDLLILLDEGKVIPVIGSGVVTMGQDQSPFYPWLAKRLADKLGIPLEKLGDRADLNTVATLHLLNRGDGNALYTRIARILRDECPLPGKALTDLASVSAFNLFLTTTFDPLLQRAIDLTRYGGEPFTNVYAFSPKTHLIDLPLSRNELGGTTVFHLLGQVSSAPGYVVWEENDELAERIDYRAQPSRFLLVMREDFLHILERWKRTIPSIMSNRVELRMLNGPQAFLAVVRPGRLRTAKPAIIPDDVGEAIVRFVAGETDDVPLTQIDAVPPLLSLVCAELNERRLANQEPQITSAQFKGRSIDILEGFYDRSFAIDHLDLHTKQPSDAPRALQRAKKLIEDRLITPDGYRENISYESIAKDLLLDSNGEPISPATAKMVLDGLVERRLLTVEERLGVRRVELTHDILTRIVKSSRDKRHEEESQERLRVLNEKAEFEKAKIIKERNKLKGFAILSSCLAIMAIGAATMAFSWYRQAKNMAYEAKKSEAEARDAIRVILPMFSSRP